MNYRIRASHIRVLSTITAVLLALPFQWKGLTGIYSWFSPFIMLNSVFVLRSLSWLNLIGIAVLILSFFKKRWFCRYLCPVGWGCDSVSKLSWRKNFSLNKFPDVGRWLALISLAAAFMGIPIFILLDPMAIFNGFFSVFSENISLVVILSFLGFPIILVISLVFPGIWCFKLCPLGGLQDDIYLVKKKVIRMVSGSEKEEVAALSGNDIERRLFLSSAAGIFAGIVTPKFLCSSKKEYLRPPGSVAPGMFNTLCVRCGNCIKGCPTDIIVHHRYPDDPSSWMTPEVSFDNYSYCIEDCNLCSKVCPGGAIQSFSVDAKKEIFMGTAIINTDKCLLADGVECDRCSIACSYNAINYEFKSEMIRSIPVVDISKCVGCGACAAICPVATIEIIPYIGRDQEM